MTPNQALADAAAFPKYRPTQDGSVECGRMFMEGDFA